MHQDDEIRREKGVSDFDWIVMPRVLAAAGVIGWALIVWRFWA